MFIRDIKIVKVLVEKISKIVQAQVDSDLNEITSALESKKRLEKEISKLTLELTEIKHQKKLEEEDLRHMVKMKEEALNIKFQKKELDLQQQHDSEVATVKDTYRDKIETRLEDEGKKMLDMYNQVLDRLPNVNLEMRKGFGDTTEVNLNNKG
jgi:predicted  nucleic acid-binding Zn-ribbon protein